MPWPELPGPIPMRRIAVVAPTRRWRSVLVAVADSGMIEPEMALRAPGSLELVAGEAELERVGNAALHQDQITALAGWAPADAIEQLGERLAPLGGSVVELPRPAGVDVPTALPRRRSSGALRPLCRHVRNRPLSGCRPRVVRHRRVRGHVRDDVRRRRRRAAARRGRALAPPEPWSAPCRCTARVALGSRARRDGGRVRHSLRGGVRSDRARANGVACSPRRAGAIAAGRRRRRRGPACGRVRHRHRQPLARKRSRRCPVGTHGGCRCRALRRARTGRGRRRVVLTRALGRWPRDAVVGLMLAAVGLRSQAGPGGSGSCKQASRRST